MADAVTHYDGWALVVHDGRVVVDIGEQSSEASIWRVGLGWPDRQEIRESIGRGSQAFPCVVVKLTDWDKIEAISDHLDKANVAIDRLTIRCNTLRDQLTLAEQRAEARS
jgi:hypothetical protein